VNKNLKKIIFIVTFFGSVFLITGSIYGYYINKGIFLPSLGIIFSIFSIVGTYLGLYKKELLQKFAGRIIMSIIGLLFCMIGFCILNSSKIPAERLFSVFMILFFGMGSVILLIGKKIHIR